MVWVKFHDRLTKGKKRGIPRGIRFVYMELSLEARPGRGAIELPDGMTDLDGVHDILGGNRKEVADALKTFCAGDEPALRFEDTPSGRVLHVVKWQEWNAIDDSAERVKRHRDAKRNGGAPPPPPVTPPVSNAPVTRYSSVAATERNGPVTRLDQIREDQRREDQIQNPLCVSGTSQPAAAPPPPDGASAHTQAILAELHAHPDLKPCANLALAERIEGRRMPAGRRLEDVRRAISDAARDAGASVATNRDLAPEALASLVLRYCDRARPPAPERGDPSRRREDLMAGRQRGATQEQIDSWGKEAS